MKQIGISTQTWRISWETCDWNRPTCGKKEGTWAIKTRERWGLSWKQEKELGASEWLGDLIENTIHIKLGENVRPNIDSYWLPVIFYTFFISEWASISSCQLSTNQDDHPSATRKNLIELLKPSIPIYLLYSHCIPQHLDDVCLNSYKVVPHT